MDGWMDGWAKDWSVGNGLKLMALSWLTSWLLPFCNVIKSLWLTFGPEPITPSDFLSAFIQFPKRKGKVSLNDGISSASAAFVSLVARFPKKKKEKSPIKHRTLYRYLCLNAGRYAPAAGQFLALAAGPGRD